MPLTCNHAHGIARQSTAFSVASGVVVEELMSKIQHCYCGWWSGTGVKVSFGIVKPSTVGYKTLKV